MLRHSRCEVPVFFWGAEVRSLHRSRSGCRSTPHDLLSKSRGCSVSTPGSETLRSRKPVLRPKGVRRGLREFCTSQSDVAKLLNHGDMLRLRSAQAPTLRKTSEKNSVASRSILAEYTVSVVNGLCEVSSRLAGATRPCRIVQHAFDQHKIRG